MALILDEEQQLLARTAREFVRARTPVSALRTLRESEGPRLDRDVYRAMAELGWYGLVVPEDLGGLGLGYAELGLVLEELGHELVCTPLFSTAALGTTALLWGGSSAQQGSLAAVAEGDHLLTLAYQEGPRHDPYRCSTLAEPSDAGFVLRGEKHYVLDAQTADTVLVVARTRGEESERQGLTVFAIEAGTPGLEMERLGMVDDRNWCHVRLDGVEVARDRVVGQPGEAARLLDPVFDRATIALAAEMLGSAQSAFSLTLEYLKTRKQFGVLIGSFQALKHRAAHMYSELELTRSCVMDALRAVDAGREDVPRMASLAKARASETLQLVTSEGIQLHGGIGVTDEADIGLYYKRARTAELLLGDAAFHRDRYATLCGY